MLERAYMLDAALLKAALLLHRDDATELDVYRAQVLLDLVREIRAISHDK